MASKKNSWFQYLLTGIVIFMTILSAFLFVPGLNTSSTATRLVIHRGTGFRAILDELRRNGSISQTWPVLATVSMFPPLRHIKPGRYLIPAGMSNFGLMYFLHNHKQDEVRVTLPEGLSLARVARILSRKLDIDSTSFMAAASDRKLLAQYGIKAQNAEGYLLPGTYNFVWAGTSREAAGLLIAQFRHFYTDSLKNVAKQQGVSETELLTLASIVEAETPLDREKALIASVYFNRLKKKMRLQADPTVQYALGSAARRLYYKDLEADSPYNTYRHNGLPPGPICNPGKASILATLYPADTKFLYFVATGKGGHYFAESLKEHAINIRKYKQALRETTH